VPTALSSPAALMTYSGIGPPAIRHEPSHRFDRQWSIGTAESHRTPCHNQRHLAQPPAIGIPARPHRVGTPRLVGPVARHPQLGSSPAWFSVVMWTDVHPCRIRGSGRKLVAMQAADCLVIWACSGQLGRTSTLR
jgi:hypothetical protein